MVKTKNKKLKLDIHLVKGTNDNHFVCFTGLNNPFLTHFDNVKGTTSFQNIEISPPEIHCYKNYSQMPQIFT